MLVYVNNRYFLQRSTHLNIHFRNGIAKSVLSYHRATIFPDTQLKRPSEWEPNHGVTRTNDEDRYRFGRVLEIPRKGKLLDGTTVRVDATTLEANAALRSIVRRDSGAGYQEFLKQLAKASGIETPTREDLTNVDKDRPKKGSNDQWKHPHDEDARITKMKDGRTHLAHKLEQAVDMDTGAILGMTVQPISGGYPLVAADAHRGRRAAAAGWTGHAARWCATRGITRARR